MAPCCFTIVKLMFFALQDDQDSANSYFTLVKLTFFALQDDQDSSKALFVLPGVALAGFHLKINIQLVHNLIPGVALGGFHLRTNAGQSPPPHCMGAHNIVVAMCKRPNTSEHRCSFSSNTTALFFAMWHHYHTKFSFCANRNSFEAANCKRP